MAGKMKVGKLTVGERLWLSRKRTGESHEAAAVRFGIHPDTYLKWERDKFGMKGIDMSGFPDVTPKPNEICVLARRRWNQSIREGKARGAMVTQSVLADALGISRLWVCRMETGTADCSRLLDFWKENKA